MNLTRKHYRLLTCLFMVAILLASSIPGKSLPKVVILSPDKLLHIAEYGILGFLVFMSVKKMSYVLLLGAIIFAGFDEFWQSFIPGRFPSIFDVIADMIGFYGVVGTLYYFSRKRSTMDQNG